MRDTYPLCENIVVGCAKLSPRVVSKLNESGESPEDFGLE